MIDDLEKKIVRALNQNARKSCREIAKELGISVTAVINKMKKFEKLGVIKGYIPIVDAKYFKFELRAVIALRLSHQCVMGVQKRIAEDTRVISIYDITGEWDSIVIGLFRDTEDLDDFIKNLLSLEGIITSVTHIVLNIVKDEKRVLV